MKITIAKSAGFCFGVKRAYDLACVNSKDCEDIYILGKLVHNDDVCRDLKKRGVREIKTLKEAKNATIIFTAHGIGPKAYEKAQSRGLKVIDTTCPKVMKAQRLAKAYARKGYEIIIFGDGHHKEVKSILEWSGNSAKTVESFAEAGKMKLSKGKKYFLISQTTQNVEEFRKIKGYFAKKLSNFSYACTICDSTDNRQREIRRLAKACDAVVVAGGKDSANSKRLFEIAKEINPKSYFLEQARQFKKSWLKNVEKIAIAAGASTPEWVIVSLVEKIRKIA